MATLLYFLFEPVTSRKQIFRIPQSNNTFKVLFSELTTYTPPTYSLISVSPDVTMLWCTTAPVAVYILNISPRHVMTSKTAVTPTLLEGIVKVVLALFTAEKVTTGVEVQCTNC